VDSGSLWRLPIALGRPLAVAVDTSAALAALPGRVIELVTVAEQTLTALRAVVVRTNALLERAEGITATAEGILRAADHAANAAAGTVEQAHTTTDRVIALLGAYSDALNRLAPRCGAWPTPPTQATSMLLCSCSDGCRSSPTRWVTRWSPCWVTSKKWFPT
jgi:hypothetical protein